MMRPKLLAVDDKAQNLFALEKLLSTLPVNVVQTTSPVEALSLALEHDFCVAIVDVQMPDMDGYELVTLLRGYASTARLPVIFVSAVFSDEYHHHRGYEAGAVDFLSKPFVPEILLSKVKIFMDLYAQRYEMKALIDQLRDSNRKLHDLNKEKDRFIGLAAHDLRAPLQNISGFSELMMESAEAFTEAQKQKIISDVYQQAEYMRILIEDLLDVAQIETGSLTLRIEAVDVAAFLSELIVHHDQLAGRTKGSKVVLGDVPNTEIELDPIRLRQVIDNLVSNAVKFSSPGSRTLVEVAPAEDGWRFYVVDEGPGIPDEERARLFDYFSQVSTTPTGGEKSTGLGLAISAKIVRAHGGEIGVDSKTGEGATFWFTLPGVKLVAQPA